MENFESKKFEGKERFGKNVEIQAIFTRHATKTDTSDVTGESLLSEKGHTEAREKGKTMETKKTVLKYTQAQLSVLLKQPV